MRSDEIKQGLARAPHRSLLRALGVSDAEMGRPFIGVVNAFSEVVPGHLHLRSVVDAVKAGVRSGGGVPMEFGVMGICDGLAMNHRGMLYSLPSRELIADTVESMTIAHAFDALVLVPCCDKIVPGMLMAAMRLNVPAIMVGGGAMLAGHLEGRTLDLNSVFEAVGQHQAGKLDDEGLEAIECNACPTCGSCSGMFTANSMNCLAEVIGMALPGNGTIPAVYSERIRFAKDSGEKVMQVLAADRKPRDILTEAAVGNALAADASLGCSTNTVLHLAAIATEAGLDFDLRRINEVAAKVPHICKIAPAGTHHMEDLYHAGGIQAVMNRLIAAGLMDGSALSVAGGTVGEAVASARVLDDTVIRPIDDPWHATGGLAVLFGNLAPAGAVVKEGAVADEMLRAQRPGARLRERGGRRGGHRRARHRRRLRGGHPRRGPQGRARHARDAQRHVHARRPGPGQGRGAHHRRPLQRRHARRRHRPRRARGARRRPHRRRARRRHHQHRHPRPHAHARALRRRRSRGGSPTGSQRRATA